MIPENTAFKLLPEGDIWPRESVVHAVDNNAGILGDYGIFLVVAIDNLVGAQPGGRKLLATASGMLVGEQVKVTNLIGGKLRADGVWLSDFQDVTQMRQLAARYCRRIRSLAIKRMPAVRTGGRPERPSERKLKA